MNTTDDSRIVASDWFTDPKQPFMQRKLFVSRFDNLMHFTVATRGWCPDFASLESEDVQSYTVSTHEDIKDNSADQFLKLQKFLSSPMR